MVEKNSAARREKTGSEAKGAKASAKRSWSGREKGLLAGLVICAIAAIVGFSLYATNIVPTDAAAKFDDMYVSEAKVAQAISEQRVRYGLESDADFASYLLTSGLNVYTYRQGVINQVALNMLVEDRAKQLGCTPTDAQVDEQVQSLKDQNNANDDESWQKLLDAQGMTEASLREQLKTMLAEEGIYEKAVPRKEASDDDVRSYASDHFAGATEKHSWRATFTGDDAEARAKEFRKQVLALGDKLSAEEFSKLAQEQSDSPTVADDKGDAGWTLMDGSSSYALALAELDKGSVSKVLATETEGNYGVAYCDDAYAFPDAEDMDSLDLSEMPESLVDELREKAADQLWESDCSAYLTSLLSDAQVTYYPIPKGAVYDVDMKLASMASGDYLDNIG